MRLINTTTLRLREFLGRPPPYAILSHTWGRNEVSFHDFHDLRLRRRRRRGWSKIEAACRLARADALEYAWVDTCCIDKSSSAELSEAINSMFEWYRRSEVCYAYLEDAPEPRGDWGGGDGGLKGSRWFRRGWTLQELLAPSRVRFFSGGWEEIGSRDELGPVLEEATGIDEVVLTGVSPLSAVSVGRRMSWASERETTRPEDRAYSLLGIFGVNMPLLYGEGGENAFVRLQEEIMRKSEDQSILAWRDEPDEGGGDPVRGILATSPGQFSNFRTKKTEDMEEESGGRQIEPFEVHHAPESPVAMTNRGLRMTGVFEDLEPWKPLHSIKLGLNCTDGDDLSRVVAIYLERRGGDRYVRVRASELTTCRSYGPQMTVYGLQTPTEGDQGGVWEKAWTHVAEQPKGLWRTSPLGEATTSVEFRRKVLQHAIFVENTTIRTSHGTYRVVAMIAPEGERSSPILFAPENNGGRSGWLQYHALDATPEGQPLVLPTIGDHLYRHPRFKGAVLLRGRFGTIYVLVVFGTMWNPATLEYNCWLDAVKLGDDAFYPRVESDIPTTQEPVVDQEAVLHMVSDTKRPASTADAHSKILPVGVFGDKACHLSISVGLKKVQGMDMFCIDIREVSPFPDPRRDNPLASVRF